ncbi:MAG: DNA-directed RNA polymerase subunit alpha C-terminal domain-containing protein [Candidatus Moraniibacteriota bacterium]
MNKKRPNGGFEDFLKKVIGIEVINIPLNNLDKDRIQKILDSIGLVGHGILQRKKGVSRRNLLELRFGLDRRVHTLREIAVLCGVSHAAISQQISKSIELLKSPAVLRRLNEVAGAQNNPLEENPSKIKIKERHVLSIWTEKYLKRVGISTIADLVGMDRTEREKMRNSKRKTYQDLKDILAEYDLKFGF